MRRASALGVLLALLLAASAQARTLTQVEAPCAGTWWG